MKCKRSRVDTVTDITSASNIVNSQKNTIENGDDDDDTGGGGDGRLPQAHSLQVC